MIDVDSKGWRKRFRAFCFPRRHTALLVAIVVFISVQPLIGEVQVATSVFSIALVALLIVALYTIQVEELVGERHRLTAERRRRILVGWSLAGAAIVERVFAIFRPIHALYLTATVCYLLFFAFVAWQELRAVVR